MTKKLQKTMTIVFLSFLVLLIVVQSAQALDKKAELKVYQRFFKAIGTEAQYNQILNLIDVQFQQAFSALFKEVAKKADNATPEEKEKIRQLLEQAMGSYFQKMRAKTTEIMPLNELITNVYYPAYSKHFTVSEIEELTAFYESPIGQKYISSIPAIMQESMTIINQKYTPQLQKSSIQLAEEEMNKIKPELEKLRKNN